MFSEGIGESKPNKSLVSGIVSAMENEWGPCPVVFHVGRRKRIIVLASASSSNVGRRARAARGFGTNQRDFPEQPRPALFGAPDRS